MTAFPLTTGLLIGSRRSLRLVERNLFVYKHGWIIILSGFFEPLFYLLSIGFGLGALIGTIPGPGGEPISYQLFVAPALLASSAMNGAISESTFNFFFKLNYNKTFTAILSTPLSPGDVAVGELIWALIRGGLYAIGFMVVMVVLGLVVSPWVVLAIPAALLIGFAFGAVGMAATSFMKTWQDFDLIQLVILPLFLFSATFYPIETYPEALRVIVQLTPLYQGVDLIRALTVGEIASGAAVPYRVPAAHGHRGADRRVAAARQAVAQVGDRGPDTEQESHGGRTGPRSRRSPLRSSRAGGVHASSPGGSSSRARRSARFRDEPYWGRPVPGFGDPDGRILLLGLAPAAHGGNRTGRVFTGDASGDFLWAALHALPVLPTVRRPAGRTTG